MKPSVGSTALVFVLLGLAAVLVGLTGLPKPILIASGVAAGLVGVGLFLRLRLAWTVGMLYALGNASLAGFRVYRAWSTGESYLVPALWLALDLYLAISLLVIRSRFATKD